MATEPKSMRFDLDGPEVIQLAFGLGDLQIHAQDPTHAQDVSISLEDRVELTLDGTTTVFEVGHWNGAAGALTSLLGRRVLAVLVEGGQLTIEFGHGRLVAFDTGIEPWNVSLTSPMPSLIVGRAGAEPLIWE